MDRRLRRAVIALDLLRAQREGATGLDRRQGARLSALVAHARASSPFYRAKYRGLPDQPSLRELPVVSKPELMGAFDDWVTDPQVDRAGVEAFIADPTRIGTPYLGRYFVCRTSGTTGHPGLFVHDAHACAVYEAFTARIDLAWLSGAQWIQMARQRARWATVLGTGGHFAGEGWMELQRHRDPWRRRTLRVFSLQRPLPEIVAALNAFDPAVLTSYPSALELLAEEQLAGRLQVRPVIVELGGESLDDDARARIAAGLGGALHDAYSASECMAMAYDCAHGWLHVNSDWVILEPVDADGRPTPPGEASHTVLLSNLANRVQPIIRYDLGDTVLARPDPCPCGNPLPAIRVQGRRDDVLRLRSVEGATIRVLPLVVGSVVDETPGVQRSQLLQTGARSLLLRLDLEPGASAERVWTQAHARLADYLIDQGLRGVEITHGAAPPTRSVTSGKFRQVIAGGY